MVCEPQACALPLARGGRTVPTPLKQKQARPADGSVSYHLADHPHRVWAMDFQVEATADDRLLNCLNAIDEHIRICLSIQVSQRWKANAVVVPLEELTSLYPTPAFIRSGKGQEFVAYARRSRAESSSTKTPFIEPGPPCQHCFAKSDNRRFRDEFLITELLTTVAEA
jgi:putative transposase